MPVVRRDKALRSVGWRRRQRGGAVAELSSSSANAIHFDPSESALECLAEFFESASFKSIASRVRKPSSSSLGENLLLILTPMTMEQSTNYNARLTLSNTMLVDVCWSTQQFVSSGTSLSPESGPLRMCSRPGYVPGLSPEPSRPVLCFPIAITVRRSPRKHSMAKGALP